MTAKIGFRTAACLALLLAACATAAGDGDAGGNIAGDKAVYHVNDAAHATAALRNRKLTKPQFMPEATFVPSGVAQIAKLQQREGYA